MEIPVTILAMRLRFILISFGPIALTAAAFGQSLGTANQFNAFIFGNASVNGGGESEGAIAVGGNFTASNNYNVLTKNAPASIGSLNDIGLYVGGNATFSNGGQLNSGGNGYVGGNFSTNNPFDLNGGGGLSYGGTLSGTVHGTTTNSNLINSNIFTQQKAYSLSQAAMLDATAANTTINMSDPNNWALNYSSAGNNKTYVVDIASSQLGGNGGNPVTLNLGGFNSTDTLIFDVTGGNTNNFGISINANGLQNRILWNFGTETAVNINNRQLEGSVLAADATVNQSTVIEGNLIANDWNTQNGPEIHSYNFKGTAPVPEPSTIAGMLIGTLGLVGLSKRRRIA